VNLPREEVEYRDTSYRAVVSGFLPRLEEIEIYRQDRVVTIETTRTIKERSHWGLGVQAGAGISTQGLVPYVGIGVSYNILTW
jgi:opacity protein-like surface antigen